MYFLSLWMSVLAFVAPETLQDPKRFAISHLGVPAHCAQDTLQEGMYQWVSGFSECGSLCPTLYIKRSHQTHYYLTVKCMDRLGKARRVGTSWPMKFLIDWQAGNVTVLQKPDPGTVDSFELQLKDDLFLLRHFRKRPSYKLDTIEQQFKYVGAIQPPLFDMDFTNGFIYEAAFEDTISMKCYEYPDTSLLPRRFQFKSDDLVVLRSHIYEVQSGEESFYLIYLDSKPKSIFLGRYEDYNQHLWVRQKDFLNYFSPVKFGRIKGYNYPTLIPD